MHVPVFTYGSYMDPDVLRRFGAEPGESSSAVLKDWRLTFSPHANIRPDGSQQVHGLVYRMHHAELDRLYGPDGYVTTYRPFPVAVVTPAGEVVALTFVEPAKEQAPDGAYLESFLAICKRMELPPAYIDGVRRQAEGLVRGTLA